MKKQLPKYFVILRVADNPLWDKYIKWLNEEYGESLRGTSDNSYYGFHGSASCSENIYDFNNNPIILTLEEWNEIVNGEEENKEEEFLPGDLVGVGNTKEEANKDFREFATSYYIGKTRKGLYIVEDYYGGLGHWEYISKTPPKQETITITIDSGEKLEITKDKARELGFNIK